MDLVLGWLLSSILVFHTISTYSLERKSFSRRSTSSGVPLYFKEEKESRNPVEDVGTTCLLEETLLTNSNRVEQSQKKRGGLLLVVRF